MTNLAAEECSLTKRLPPEGVIFGGVHIGALHWHGHQDGIVIDVSFDSGYADCHLWLAGEGWLTWCETQLGTDDVTTIDSVLLAELVEWGISPWLTASGATVVRHHAAPPPCSLLPEQVAVTFSWQVDQHRFQAVLFGDTRAYLDGIAASIPPKMRPVGDSPPIACALYVGGCHLSVGDVQRLTVGAGLRVQAFGDPRGGEFVLLLTRRIAARITFHGETEMHIDELVQDIGSLLDDERLAPPPDDMLSLNIDALPQILLVEVGKVDITLGALREVKTGDLLPAETSFSSSVTLRLNGRAVGQGELIRCGNDFLVRVCRWYPSETSTDPIMQDGVNAW